MPDSNWFRDPAGKSIPLQADVTFLPGGDRGVVTHLEGGGVIEENGGVVFAAEPIEKVGGDFDLAGGVTLSYRPRDGESSVFLSVDHREALDGGGWVDVRADECGFFTESGSGFVLAVAGERDIAGAFIGIVAGDVEGGPAAAGGLRLEGDEEGGGGTGSQ